MHQTPWTKKSSTLTSDRLRSSSNSPSNSQSNNKGKGKLKELPKSKEIRKLEALAEGVRSASGQENDPKGGCFCQARNHNLSTYTPLCSSCGLVLCDINIPSFACPHCSSVLLTPIIRTSLTARLDEEISQRLAKEDRERELAIEEARRTAGAFPTLAAPSPSLADQSSAFTPRPVNQAHKVLSLNSKTKKATVTSYTKSPTPSRPISRAAEDTDPEPIRVPKPASDVSFVGKLDPSRPWADLKGESVTYVPPPKVAAAESSGGGIAEGSKKSRRRKGGKRKEKENELDDSSKADEASNA